ncbi:MAG: aminopeptidase [Trueperaceae bacterium]|nr:aminopeptidase [Trueperaceae bacterium]
MLHPLHEKYADLLVGYCVAVKPGDLVSVQAPAPALPLARAVTRAVLRAGGRPLLRIDYPQFVEDVLELAPEAYFDAEPVIELDEARRLDARIRVAAPTNSRALQGADKGRMARLARQSQPVQELMMARTRWVGTLYPTDAAAQDAGMSLDDFERFVYGAMFLYDDDPVARWGELRSLQARLIERLAQADEVRLRGPGTDLRLSVKGRTWINSDGRRNMPSGEVFTGPVEDSAEGVVAFDLPSSVGGVVVRGVRLRFEAGRVVEASADEGEDLLLARLDTDPGARYLGEIGIGTNDRITRPILNTLYDEKIGGTVHLALGRSYPESGGTNHSAIHWDLITDLRRGGELLLDGEPFQRDGRFLA